MSFTKDHGNQRNRQADADNLGAQRGRPPRLLPTADAAAAYRLVLTLCCVAVPMLLS